MDDPDFAARIRERDGESLREVVRAYLPQVLRAARAAGLALQLAEDVTQDKGHPLLGWNLVQTAVDSLPYLSIVDPRVHGARWPRPAPGAIEPLLKHFFDVVHLLVSS